MMYRKFANVLADAFVGRLPEWVDLHIGCGDDGRWFVDFSWHGDYGGYAAEVAVLNEGYRFFFDGVEPVSFYCPYVNGDVVGFVDRILVVFAGVDRHMTGCGG